MAIKGGRTPDKQNEKTSLIRQIGTQGFRNTLHDEQKCIIIAYCGRDCNRLPLEILKYSLADAEVPPAATPPSPPLLPPLPPLPQGSVYLSTPPTNY